MREHLDMDAALRAVAADRAHVVPPAKFAALIRAGLVRARGHGKGARHALTDAGRARLASPPPPHQAVRS